MAKLPGFGQVFESHNQQWKVSRLIELAAGLVPFEKPISSFKEWKEQPLGPIRNFGDFYKHIKRVHDADLTYPIILSADGWIMDGCHRLLKAKLCAHQTVTCVQFETTPSPDVPDMEGACWAEMVAAESTVNLL